MICTYLEEGRGIGGTFGVLFAYWAMAMRGYRRCDCGCEVKRCVIDREMGEDREVISGLK